MANQTAAILGRGVTVEEVLPASGRSEESVSHTIYVTYHYSTGNPLGAVSGHLGSEKMLSILKERYYWPGHYKDIQDLVSNCRSCATRRRPVPKQHAPLQTIQAGYPMQIVAVDIMGPLPVTKDGNSYVLVAGDYFTRWTEAYAIPNQEAQTVANKLTEEFFSDFHHRNNYTLIRVDSLNLSYSWKSADC
jgi:hypothetical protein